MHEVMCSNGVEEGCDYMIATDTAKNQYKLGFAQDVVLGAVLLPVQIGLMLTYLLTIFVFIGRMVTE